ncbi:hypothetical protein FOPG_15876 [Fusarium oxysporum f. sp. conglutinans race 2 54008]|uniref:Rhodopsin domain-containing protein n=1 Tax=Fusarium oxysporum f. sp. conglutinans race 2 54008 TaxID=1089457 RepID=X0H843_FUSOX|nr:hypothetical protein FOPG_15876 [Fusarium oxysporum f. sp. conglutinans race 2 54008]
MARDEGGSTGLRPDLMDLDDWLVIATTISLYSQSVWLYRITSVGPNHVVCKRSSLPTVFKCEYIGFPTSDVPDHYHVEPVLFYNWIMQVLYDLIRALVKSSILFFLLRLGGHRRRIRWSIYALNTFIIALMIAIFTTVIFQIIPIAAFKTTESQYRAPR